MKRIILGIICLMVVSYLALLPYQMKIERLQAEAFVVGGAAGGGTATQVNDALGNAYDTSAELDTLFNARCLESVFGDTLGTGLLLTSTTLSVSAILQKYHGVDPSANVLTFLGNATFALMRADLDLEAGTDFYSKTASDTAHEAELNDSAGLLAALDDETGTGASVFNIAPVFVTSFGIGSAILLEPDIEIIDEAATEGLTHTELMYLKDFTGVSGTGAICGNVSPQLTTPDLGAATADSITLDASATPGWVFRDSNNAGTDKEIAKIYSNAITTTDGAEDGETHIQVMDSGSEKTFIEGEGTTNAEFVKIGPPDCTYDMKIYHSVNAVNDTWSGDAVIRTVDSGVTSIYGQVLHVDSDGELILADADVASAAAAPGIFVALEAGTGAKLVLMRGFITETDWNWTVGALMYLDDDPTENEGWTMVAGIPATAGDQVQVLGVAVSADTIYFHPEFDLTEVP